MQETPYENLKGMISVALKDFLPAGLFPSGSHASRSIAALLPTDSATIVEYGSGEEALTTEILRRLDERSQLVSIEGIDDFAQALRRIRDPRLTVVQGDLLSTAANLKTMIPAGADAVVSSIPLSFLSPAQNNQLVEHTKAALKDEGIFVVCQHSLAMLRVIRRHFKQVRTILEPRDASPAYIIVASERMNSSIR